MAFVFLGGGSAYAQAPPQTEMLRAVEQHARQDAQSETPPATIQDLIALYGEQAKAEGVAPVQMVDAYRAAYAAARPPKSFWKEYLPHLGWVTAVVLFVLTFFRDTLRDVLGPRLKALGDRLYDRVAGYPIFWWKARANYRKSLVSLYKRFKIPFMADRYLDMDQIYVPLKVEGASDIDQIVDFGEVAHYKRLVVTGQPGSGKSMLLRRLALLHATGGVKKLPDQPTPVLFELHRLNKDDRGVFEHLVEIFRLHKFPEAGSFVKRSLARGKLMLLFDGLDEVDSSRRAAEVKKLKDFIQEHDKCRVMVTCRTAVYRGEFDELADRRLQIVDFSDAQIESFLSAWPGMPPNKSVGQLLAALDERPLIKALARRPLLLTIIAFLYTEVEDFRLPYSRADFYKRAADVLLGGLKGELNKYEAVEKQFVLEHLALYNQTKQAKNEDDRLTLERKTVLDEIRKVLPQMSRKEEDAPSVLEEIVERSSLLLPLDNKSRYVFSHLTLQEYFAASALRAYHARLLEHFAADRDAWRETAKLWCGLAQDSTDFVNALFKLEPVTALECLADAKRLAPETADVIIDHFEKQFGGDDARAEAVSKALGAVATGNSPRNRRVFDFLVRSFAGSADIRRRELAASALSLTNNPEAAAHLVQALPGSPSIMASVGRLGDLAVPAIEERIADNADAAQVEWLTYTLSFIGTPKAVKSLVKLLWHETTAVRTYAALNLGSRLHLPQAEAVVRATPLPPSHRWETWYRWVWSPFEEGESTIAIVAGRIGYLIDSPFVTETEIYSLDPRIAVPIVVHMSQREAISSQVWRDTLMSLIPTTYSYHSLAQFSDANLLEIISQRDIKNPAHEILKSNMARAVRDGGMVNNRLRKILKLLALLNTPRQIRLLRRLSNDNRPTLVHWRNIFKPVEFKFERSWLYHVIGLVLFVLPALSIAGFFLIVDEKHPSEPSLHIPFAAIAMVIVGGIMIITLVASEGSWRPGFTLGMLFTPFRLIGVRDGNLSAEVFITHDLAVEITVGLFLPLNVYLGSLLFSQWLSAPWIFLLWVALLGPLYLLYWLGKRKERLAGNPLVGLLDEPVAGKAERVVR